MHFLHCFYEDDFSSWKQCQEWRVRRSWSCSPSFWNSPSEATYISANSFSFTIQHWKVPMIRSKSLNKEDLLCCLYGEKEFLPSQKKAGCLFFWQGVGRGDGLSKKTKGHVHLGHQFLTKKTTGRGFLFLILFFFLCEDIEVQLYCTLSSPGRRFRSCCFVYLSVKPGWACWPLTSQSTAIHQGPTHPPKEGAE